MISYKPYQYTQNILNLRIDNELVQLIRTLRGDIVLQWVNNVQQNKKNVII